MIVQASGDLPRVELFVVDKIEGWDSVGCIDNRNIVDVPGERCMTDQPINSLRLFITAGNNEWYTW